MNTTLQIIKKYQLEKYFKILITENNGNNNPYHNFYHTCCVINNCHKISENEKINDSNIRLLLIAAIFHDFNHSAGKYTDDKNIEEALTVFRQNSEESENDNQTIERLIRCTQYPYNKNEDLGIGQQIIRDADILQQLEDNWIQQCLFGLNKELNGKNSVSVKDLENQVKFTESLEIFTHTARMIFRQKIKSNIADIEFLKTIINQ